MWRWSRVLDHNNGLVLYTDDDLRNGSFFVCNPVTRRWKCLPRCPSGDEWRWHLHAFLVFHPAVSKHYRVLLVSRKPKKEVDGAEWPPSRWRCHEFSSRTGRWQEKVFVREGEAAGTVANLTMDYLPYSMEPRWRFSAYWQGNLYVHCHDATYRVIKSPIDRTVCYSDVKSFLGRSEKGVYFAAIYKWQLRVWILDTGSSPYRAEWVLKHNRVLKPDDWYAAANDYHRIQLDGPWILDENEKRKTRADVDWSSDDDDVIQTVDSAQEFVAEERIDLYKNKTPDEFESNSNSNSRYYSLRPAIFDVLASSKNPEIFVVLDSRYYYSGLPDDTELESSMAKTPDLHHSSPPLPSPPPSPPKRVHRPCNRLARGGEAVTVNMGEAVKFVPSAREVGEGGAVAITMGFAVAVTMGFTVSARCAMGARGQGRRSRRRHLVFCRRREICHGRMRKPPTKRKLRECGFWCGDKGEKEGMREREGMDGGWEHRIHTGCH
ncbi:hypothetical protein EJB05_43646, partial [Eragrostis curvula]